MPAPAKAEPRGRWRTGRCDCGPAPCDGCGTRSSCRDREVACEQFALYAQVGGGRARWEAEPRQPSQVLYDRIFTTPFRECGALTGMSIDERRAAAKKLSARGHNQTVIAQLLGVGKTTVRKDLAWPNEPPHRANPKIYTPRESKWLIGRRAAVRDLAAKGHTRREIAQLLGIDKQRVNRDPGALSKISPMSLAKTSPPD